MAKKKENFKQFTLNELLKFNFKEDKTRIYCVHKGDMNFQNDKVYKVYLSHDSPRVYDCKSHQFYASDVDDLMDSNDFF